MKIYADTPQRRRRQIVADVGFVLWALLWVWVAVKLYSLILVLATPGEAIESAGSSLSENMVGAGEAIDGLPVVGESVRAPFDRMSQAGMTIADAGRAQQEAITRLAMFAAVCFAAIPIATLAAVWLPIRLRFARRISASKRYLDSTADLDLFAVRALARQPISTLARIDDDPVGRWRAGDQRVIRALADLELRDEGLHLPM